MAGILASGGALSLDIRPGNVYLVEERRPKLSYDIFEHSISNGCTGLIVTRDFPERLREDKELMDCKILWLTNLVGDGRLNPTAIGIMMSHMRNFIEGKPKAAVLMDGLEYLISLNTYDRMLQFMHQLKDIVVTSEGILIVPIDPRTMTERELALLERNTEVISSRQYTEMHEDQILSSETGAIRLLDVGQR